MEDVTKTFEGCGQLLTALNYYLKKLERKKQIPDVKTQGDAMMFITDPNFETLGGVSQTMSCRDFISKWKLLQESRKEENVPKKRKLDVVEIEVVEKRPKLSENLNDMLSKNPHLMTKENLELLKFAFDNPWIVKPEILETLSQLKTATITINLPVKSME